MIMNSMPLYFLPEDIDIVDFGKVKKSLLKRTDQGFLIYTGAYQAWVDVLLMIEKSGIEVRDQVENAGYIDTDDIYNIQSTGLAVNLNCFSCKEKLVTWFVNNIDKTHWLWYRGDFNYIIFSPKNNKYINNIFSPNDLSKFLSGRWIREPN